MGRFFEDTIIDLAVAETVVGPSIPLGAENYKNFSFIATFGDITGAFKVEISNDRRANPYHPDYASARWYDATAEYTSFTQPAGSAGTAYIPFCDGGVGYIRLTYTHSAGEGVLYVDAHANE